MDLRQLETFERIVERGSFSGAADALGVTQPAVSQQMRTLERAVGGPLFDRRGRRLALTPRGEVVHRHTQRLLAVGDDLRRELAEGAGAPSGQLVVGASTGPGDYVLPRLLGGFHREYPDVSVSLTVEATRTIIERVLERDLELGVVGARRPHRSLHYEPFLHDRVVLVVPPGHRFAGRRVTLEELTSEPLVLMQEGSGVRSVIEDELRAAGVPPRRLRVAMVMGLNESAKAAVEEGHGVSFLSSLAVEKELRLGTLATASVSGIEAGRDFYAVRPARRGSPQPIEAFMAYCRLRLGPAEPAPAPD
jgi:DNA-binding transcriptional LysR family regulator